MRILKEILEYVSSMWGYVKTDIPSINMSLSEMNTKIGKMCEEQKKQSTEIQKCFNYIQKEDTEFVIYKGKEYKICQSELAESQDGRNAAELRLWLIEHN